MVSTRKERQSNRRLLSQLDDFDQDVIIGNVASENREAAAVNEGSNDRDFTVGTSGDSLVFKENTVKVETLERCINGRIDKEVSNIVGTVECRIQNAILTVIVSIVVRRLELAIRFKNTSPGQDATSVTANSEHGEHVEIIASFKSESRNTNVPVVSNVNEET